VFVVQYASDDREQCDVTPFGSRPVSGALRGTRSKIEPVFNLWKGNRDLAELTRVRTLATLDLTDCALYRGGFPHPVFTRLRREAPVWWQAIPTSVTGCADDGFWVLSRYNDVQAANRDSDLFSAIDGPSVIDRPEIRGTMLVSMDGRDHTRQRRLISAGFTPRMVGRLEEQMRRWAVSIIDAALERGTCNFVEDVAYQLPMHMIADIVGIPVEDRRWLFTLANDSMAAGDPQSGVSPQQMAMQAEMFQYARQLGQQKRTAPQDDVWTILSTVEIETEDGGRTALSEMELDLFFLVLTVAGSETTRNAITHGLMALVDHPEQLDTLRNDPTVLGSAVEEILRWSSPVSYFARRATRDTEIRGVRIAAGQRITLWYPSANRDEDVFDDPFRFDIRRSPNEHVAFGGGGPHFCLGANLARREIAILFEELLRRTRRIEVLGPPVYSPLGIHNPILVAPQALPVRLE
jgi:cytochrome P450